MEGLASDMRSPVLTKQISKVSGIIDSGGDQISKEDIKNKTPGRTCEKDRDANVVQKIPLLPDSNAGTSSEVCISAGIDSSSERETGRENAKPRKWGTVPKKAKSVNKAVSSSGGTKISDTDRCHGGSAAGTPPEASVYSPKAINRGVASDKVSKPQHGDAVKLNVRSTTALDPQKLHSRRNPSPCIPFEPTIKCGGSGGTNTWVSCSATTKKAWTIKGMRDTAHFTGHAEVKHVQTPPPLFLNTPKKTKVWARDPKNHPPAEQEKIPQKPTNRGIHSQLSVGRDKDVHPGLGISTRSANVSAQNPWKIPDCKAACTAGVPNSPVQMGDNLFPSIDYAVKACGRISPGANNITSSANLLLNNITATSTPNNGIQTLTVAKIPVEQSKNGTEGSRSKWAPPPPTHITSQYTNDNDNTGTWTFIGKSRKTPAPNTPPVVDKPLVAISGQNIPKSTSTMAKPEIATDPPSAESQLKWAYDERMTTSPVAVALPSSSKKKSQSGWIKVPITRGNRSKALKTAKPSGGK